MKTLARSLPLPALLLASVLSAEPVQVGTARFADPIPLPGARGAAISLAAADFDEDGMPDLVAGFGGVADSALLYRGSVEALFPSEAVRGLDRFTVPPFPTAPVELALPVRPDFLAAGDFDADGHADLLAASRDRAELVVLPGDGRASFGLPRRISLPDLPTSLLTADLDREDGLPDVVVALRSARLLVFESAHGAFVADPESIPLPSAPRSLAAGVLDDDPFVDLAVALDRDVVVLAGQDRRLFVTPPEPAGPRSVRRLEAGSAIDGIAFSRLGDVGAGGSLTLTTADGDVRRLRTEGRRRAPDAAAAPFRDVPAGRFAPRGDSETGSRTFALRIGGCDGGDLLRLVPGRAELELIEGCDGAPVARTIPLPAPAIAVLPMRLNMDPLADLVVATSDPSHPLVAIPTLPTAVFTVNATTASGDVTPGNGVCLDGNGQCSLYAATQEANALAGSDAIQFSLGGIPIFTGNASPATVTSVITFDGTSSGGGWVQIDVAGGLGSGFSVNSGSVTVRGFLLTRSGAGVFIGNANGNYVEGNRIGTDLGGGSGLGNTSGVVVNGNASSTGSFIGGTTAAARNVISGNSQHGVNVAPAAGEATVIGNRVGTSSDGTGARPNDTGIRVSTGTGTKVGGTTAGSGNLVSGNTSYGLYLAGDGAVVQGNLIGTNVTGTAALANGIMGIESNIPANLTVGGGSAAARNVISGNTGTGFRLYNNATTATISGNYIGLGSNGSTAIPNGSIGLFIQTNGVSAAANQITGNTISGNLGRGISLASGKTQTIQGNRIGTDATGSIAVGNGAEGILLVGDATQTITGNVISGNVGDGIYVTGGSGHVLRGNFIGTDATGSTDLGNGGNGIRFAAGGTNTIGGTGAGEANVVAWNDLIGIRVDNASANVSMRANRIFGNGGLGIDLGGDGPDIPDPLDGDTGPNGRQNFPLVSSVTFDGANSTISGSMTSLAFQSFTLDLFSNSAIDPSYFGEAETFLGSTNITLDGTGYGTWNLVVPGSVSFVNGTATYAGNTSEISAAYSIPKEASPGGDLRASKGSGTAVVLSFTPACGAANHSVFRGNGPIGSVSWSNAYCTLGQSSPVTFDPGPTGVGDLMYFVLVGQTISREGSYGRNSLGVELPDSTGVGTCDRNRVLTGSCP